MVNKIIFYLFCLLFALTPLVWYSDNFELFEFNKMIFVYFLTTLITGFWIINMFREKRLIFRRTPLDIPLMLFLISQIISTIISIDPHTSIYGYYSRSNGGLLSIISYLLLYWALVSNINKDQAINIIKAALVGGLVVSLWAIPEHFGISPSCMILRNEFSANCWIQDVQARVFATLGQPNWLAAYLAMLIFPAFYFYLKAKSIEEKIFAFSFLGTFYLAFTYTYSRGATFGLAIGTIVFLILLSFEQQRKESSRFARTIKPTAFVLISFLVINLIFGSAFTRIQFSQILPSQSINQKAEKPSSGLTQLENGGTESGQIRLIVWRGAWEIFKHYPVFGSGVETFAYSYYQFRPVEHNLVSEWDFLYNKAHNEYLNYLATTGAVGFGAYMFVIFSFLYTGIVKIFNFQFSIFNHQFGFKTSRPTSDTAIEQSLLIGIIASYIGYLIQNFFGFSVVIIALFFFLFPGLFYILNDNLKILTFPKFLNPILHPLSSILSRPLISKGFQVVVVIFMIFFSVITYYLWYADTLFAQGERNSEAGKPGAAYNYLTEAVIYNNREPYYKSELGYAASAAAASLFQDDATLSAHIKKQAVEQTQRALEISPKNVSFYRTAILTNYNLSTIDPTFMEKTLKALDDTIRLAPTDPKLLYNKAVILGQIDRNNEAKDVLAKAIALKKNYREAYIALALFLFDDKKYPEAVDNMRKALQLVPADPEVLKYLNEWGKTGIATDEAKVTR